MRPTEYLGAVSSLSNDVWRRPQWYNDRACSYRFNSARRAAARRAALELGKERHGRQIKADRSQQDR
jgi:hypothetical protein